MKLFRRAIAPIIIGLAAILIYFLLNLFELNRVRIDINEFYGEQFFAVLATLYAIITALILVKGIESFDSLGNAINCEAMKIRSLNAYFHYFEGSSKASQDKTVTEIRQRLFAYVENVLEQKTAFRSSKNDQLIDQCVQQCANLDVIDENDRIALTEVIRGLDDLRKLRADRVNVAQTKIPGYLIGMLAFMTLSIMLPFYLHHQTGITFNYYIIFVLGTFGSFIFFLLTDINRPYEGLWQIDLNPFLEARSEVARSMQ